MQSDSELKRIKLVFGSFIVLLTIACTVTPIENPTVDGGPAFEGICFESEILPFFVSRCGSPGCHNSEDRADDIDLTNFEGIRKELTPGDPANSEIIEYMYETDADDIMPPPPAPPIALDQIKLIEDWIRDGAQYTTNCSNTTCNLDREISFSGDILPIIDLYCFGCHSTSDPQGGYSYSTHAETMKSVNDGTLIGSIRFEGGFVAMPYKSTIMSACNIDLINKWVEQGSKDN